MIYIYRLGLIIKASLTAMVCSALVCSALVYSTAVNANIINPDFEHWENGQLQDWPTIDSGISIIKDTGIVKHGSAAAKISVNTTSQSATDLQQSFSVTAGQTYQFSVWVFHTQGKVKARLFIDGYRGYSDPTLTNQWQQMSYRYEATSSKNIEIGLRFYDLSGFNVNEVVYIDDFKPSATLPAPDDTNCQQNALTLSLTTDRYANETSWQLLDTSGSAVDSGDNLANNTNYNLPYCLANGDYQLTDQTMILATGGQFGYSETKSFTLSADNGTTAYRRLLR